MLHAFGDMWRMIFQLHRLAVLVAVGVALVATAYGHRMPATQQQDQAVAFMLATGATAEDLCGNLPAGSDHSAARCMACHVVAAVILPSAPNGMITLPRLPAPVVIAPGEMRVVLTATDPAHPSQGPPLA